MNLSTHAFDAPVKKKIVKEYALIEFEKHCKVFTLSTTVLV
jgi:hypothetical protein